MDERILGRKGSLRVEKVSTLRAATVLPLIEVRSLDFSGDREALDNGYSIMKRDGLGVSRCC